MTESRNLRAAILVHLRLAQGMCTTAEVALAMGVGRQMVARHMDKLERMGLVEFAKAPRGQHGWKVSAKGRVEGVL